MTDASNRRALGADSGVGLESAGNADTPDSISSAAVAAQPADAASEVTHAKSVRRLGWGLADQAVSSLSNFGVGIAVARSVSAREFGIFAIVFSIYTIAIGVTRSLATDPLVVRFSGATGSAATVARRAATGLGLMVGIGAGLLCVIAAVVVQGDFGALILALGIGMPGLLLQDAWRNVFFSTGQGLQALLNDALWMVLLVPAFVVCRETGHLSAASLTLAWGLAATAAAVIGGLQAGFVPAPHKAMSWLSDNRSLWPRYLAESVSLTGTQQLYFFAIGAIGGLVALGQIKLAMVALGPVNVLVQGVGLVAVPEAVRAMHMGRRRLDVVCAAISVLIGSGALVWGLLIMLAPRHWTIAISGSSWTAAAALVLPLSILQVLNGANTGAFVGLRAFKAASRSLRTRTTASIMFCVGAIGGVAISGASGAAYGLAIASGVNFCLWWAQYDAERKIYYDEPVTTKMSCLGTWLTRVVSGHR